MSVEQAKQPTPRPAMPDGRPETWVYLNDLPVPPEVVAEVDAFCREYRLGKAERLELIERETLGYYFAGRTIALMDSPRGRVVLKAGDSYTADFGSFVRAMTPELRSKVLILGVHDPNDTTTTIG